MTTATTAKMNELSSEWEEVATLEQISAYDEDVELRATDSNGIEWSVIAQKSCDEIVSIDAETLEVICANQLTRSEIR
jgi:hypothetical protein